LDICIFLFKCLSKFCHVIKSKKCSIRPFRNEILLHVMIEISFAITGICNCGSQLDGPITGAGGGGGGGFKGVFGGWFF